MLAVVLALLIRSSYLEVSRFRWDTFEHDRNAHCRLGFKLGYHLRHFEPIEALLEVNRQRMWPPFHGLLVAGLMVPFGLDHRLAYLPSLAGWAGTSVLAFFIAQAIVRRGGVIAGAVAMLFFLSSPTHREYAMDAMLESLGACLSLLAIYAYLRASAVRSLGAHRFLSLALTALFFTKYNYWLMAAAALLADYLLSPAGGYRTLGRSALRDPKFATWAARRLRDPSTYLVAGLLIAGCTIRLLGISKTGSGFFYFALVAALARIGWWLFRTRWEPMQAVDPHARQIIYWHLLPVVVWFLIPKHIGYFLYFLSPANAPPTSEGGFLEGVKYYWGSLAAEYHFAPFSFYAAAGLAGFAVLCLGALRREARVVVVFLAISAFLAVSHPNRKTRFAHTWTPAIWILAGAGAATILSSRAAARLGVLRPAAAAAAVATLAISHAPALLAYGRPAAVSETARRISTLDLSDYYLPLLAGRRPALLSTVPAGAFCLWSFLERYGDGRLPELEVRDFERRVSAEGQFERWLGDTDCDSIVFLDIPPGSRFHFKFSAFEKYHELRGLLARQSLFREQEKRHFPEYGCTVSFWVRAGKEE